MRDPVQRIKSLVRKRGIIRSRDLTQLHIPRTYLRLAVERGELNRVGRGIYCLPGEMLAHPTLAEVCKRVPNAVVCLLSALAYHELTTHVPQSVHLAIDHKARVPKVDFVTLQCYRFSGEAFKAGVEIVDVGGVKLKIYGAAKCIADCFKFRNKIGLNVAIEALREGLRKRKVTIDDLVQYGRVCRVENVMRPYIEALLG